MICNLCLGQEYIYVYMSISWHLPLVRVQKLINIVISFCYYHSKSCPKNLPILSLSLCYLFFPTFFFFCITRTFHECQIWGSAKWFFSKSNFLLGGECIYLMFTGTWNPSRYFLESEEIWDVQLYSIWGPEESYSG